MMRLLRCMVAFAALGSATQIRSAKVLVEDTSGRAIDGAQIEVRRQGVVLRARTDGSGAALLQTSADSGSWTIRVTRLGFAPFVGEVLPPLHGGALVITLEPHTLEPFRIRERMAETPRLRDVDGRIARRIPNASVMREEIEARNPVALSQLLRRTPGIRVADSSGATIILSSRGEKFENMRMVNCRLRILLDGVILPASFDVDQIPPSQVYAIEVYSGVARVPPAMAGIRRDAVCGLVAIWTISG